jgi:hypothetical protein
MTMRFTALDDVRLPCTFEQLVPGRLHPDGRRYLPMVVLRVTVPDDDPARAVLVGVVDRHHRVDEALVGRTGAARLIFLLSSVRVQSGRRQGLFNEEGLPPGRPSTAPLALGRVVAVPAWETELEHLPYESLYTELVLDVGIGTVGVRTSATAASLAESIGLRPASASGTPRVEPGDWLEVRRSRIDILAFEPS